MNEKNRLVLIGNGFDFAHGLKTSYKHFLNWYLCESFESYCKNKTYSDSLIEITNKYTGTTTTFSQKPTTFDEVLNFLKINNNQDISYRSRFFKDMLDVLKVNNWVDIERFYFRALKKHFLNPDLEEKQKVVRTLNQEFNVLIEQLAKYLKTVNADLALVPDLCISPNSNYGRIFVSTDSKVEVKYLNFNYTETLNKKYRLQSDDVIHIHGRVADLEHNPIIFGYGDESDPTYQSIEDTGENIYLDHIKSFGYFKTNEYHRLLSFIDLAAYNVSIVGHSCGLSDRVLLNEIFEHSNCKEIEIFYHKRPDGTDNFTEITQEVSRHFKPSNKNSMRRKIKNKDSSNIIPQTLNIRL